MATSPGNPTSGTSPRCTIRHLVDAVCKIRRQKQCATTARVHKAVRQQLQRNVEVEEVLEQLNVATSTGELWRVDNNGVTSYREPPKGTSKEHLKWSADKHAGWPTKDQHSGQFMMGHVKYPQNEHLIQPANEHLTQRTHEHLPWTMADQLRSSTAEPLRDHMMEPSRCSMNEPFMWPMAAESMRWPAMNDPMSWSAPEPLRQTAVEAAPQQRSEATSWPMNEPFRRPMNDPLAWQMNQSLRGPMAEQFAWHVTEPLRHPMADPLAWSVPEPLRRPMTEQLSWPGNDQLRRSMAEPLGWTVATPEPFRRPTAGEHFNWCAPADALRQTAKDVYTKPVKDTSLVSRNSNDASAVWPTRDAAHISTKALSRSITNSQKDPYKETSASTFACPASQTMDNSVLPLHKNRSISPSTGNSNNKFQSHPVPGPCKDLNSSCAELQRTCKHMPSMHKDMRLREGMSQFGATQNQYQPTSHSTGEMVMMRNSQGFCVPPDGPYGCLSNCSGNPVDSETHALGLRRPQQLHHGNEIAPQIPAMTPVGKEQCGRLLEPSPCAGKGSGASGNCNDSGKAFRLDKRLDSLDMLPIASSTANRMSAEVLQVARSLFEDSRTEKRGSEHHHTQSVEADSSTACHNVQSDAGPCSFPSAVDNPGDATLSQPQPCTTSMRSKSPSMLFISSTGNEEPVHQCNTTGDFESDEIRLSEVDLGSCVSGSFSDSAAKNTNERGASIQSLTSSLDCSDDLCQSSVNCIVKSADNDQESFSMDLHFNKESVVTDYKVPYDLESAGKFQSEPGSQIVKLCHRVPKCKRNLGKRRQPSKRKRLLNCNSFTQLTSAVRSAVKVMHSSKDIITPHRIKSLIMSKYEVSPCSIWCLTGRILQCCAGAVRSGWLRKKKRLYVPLSVGADRCQMPQNDIDPDNENRLHPEIRKLPNANSLLVNDFSGDDGVDAITSSPRAPSSSGPCSLTDKNQGLEMCRSTESSLGRQEEMSPCQRNPSSAPLDNACRADQEMEMTTDESSTSSNHISLMTRQLVANESSKRRAVDMENGGSEEGSSAPVTDDPADVNPKGLIDGLTRFFTPSNKRNSRVSRNTLQRTLEQMAKNRSSPKKSRLLSQVSQRRQKLHQSQTESFKAAAMSALSSGGLQLEGNKKLLLRRNTPSAKTPSGRRREQLQDGLSHFFAVEGKRRSCTLGRSLGNDSSSSESSAFFTKFSLQLKQEYEISIACGRIVRSRARSLSLSGTRDGKTLALSSKKQQQQLRNGDRESDVVSRQNGSRRGMLFCGKRRSRTLSANARSSQQSTSTFDCVKSALPPRNHKSSSPEGSSLSSSVALDETSLGNAMSTRLADGHHLDSVHLKSSFVPSKIVKTTCRALNVLEQDQLTSCQSSSSVLDTSKSSSSLSFYSKSTIPSLCTSFTSTGKSALVKLTRLSSEDCSALLCPHGGSSTQFETVDSVECEQLPTTVKPSCTEGAAAAVDDDCAATLETEEDLSTERPTTLDMAEAHRIVQPSMTPNDMILFRKAQKIAAERILVTQELNHLDPCQPTPPRIQFGPYELTTTHSSLYPTEFARLPKLFICEFCLKYLKSQCALQVHMTKCRPTCPPGSELYRADALSVFEVSGDVTPVYCQNICLLARLFVGSKSPLQFNMSPFLFYILTLNDDTGSHLIGYFAKEKYASSSSSSAGVSIVNLLVLPQHQKKGYGDFLIQFSYLICRLNKNPGSPLKPLSTKSLKVFQSNWSKTIMECLKAYSGPEHQLTIRDISLCTGIHPNDISSTLLSLQLIDRTKYDFGAVLVFSDGRVEKLVKKWVLPYVDKRIRIDLKSLHWTKSSIQHILKSAFELEKLNQVVRRKSARKLQQKRRDHEFLDDGASEVQTKSKEGGRFGENESQEGSLLRATKRKTTSSLDVSPSKNVRLSSPECSTNASHVGSSGRLSCSDKFETSEEERTLAYPIESVDTEPAVKSQKSVAKNSKSNETRSHEQSSLLTDSRTADMPDSLAEGDQMSSRPVDQRTRDDVTDRTNQTKQQPGLTLEESKTESGGVVEKKSVRSVEVQTDAYESEYSDDDDSDSSSSSSSSSSGSCSNCCNSSDESEVDEAEERSLSSHKPTHTTSIATTDKTDAVKESATENDEDRSENSVSTTKDDVVSSLGLSAEVDSNSVTDAATAADDRTAECLFGASCETVSQGVINDLLTPESLDRVPDQMTPSSDQMTPSSDQMTPSSAKSGSSTQNNTINQLTELGEENSQQLFGFQDSNEQTTFDHSDQILDEPAVQRNFSKMPVSTDRESFSKTLASQHGEILTGSHHEAMHDAYSETRTGSDSFQFGSAHTGSAPNLAIESPLSMNSSSEMGSCSVEQTPSQAYSDCAQVHNAYSMENVGTSPACGFVNNQSLTQITSPGGSSQITSPVSNHSFNITRCSPAIGNGAGYSNTTDRAANQQQQLNSTTGTTFKMPVEDNRFASTASAYPANGFSAAMASPASLGQCSYMGQYAEQSPGGQCNVMNQNSPNALGYNMPTPSPTNSSSRSFNMASPNTNAYHGQPTGPHAYDRSCPSAPVLSYARVIPQQLSSATDNVPWTHIYPPQAAGYSLIKFPEQDLVPQHAVTLPRNLLPAQPAVAVQQHLTQVNLVPLPAKPTKCPTSSAQTASKQHRRCGKSCKSASSSGLSTVRSQTVAPNVTIQPGTNMITSYNVINMNVDYRAQHPPIAAYPSSPYISNAAFINDAQQMQSLNIYQHRAISFPRQPQSHNNVYTAAYGYINGAIAQQSFNINVNGMMRQ